jgi:hypothetical protein
MFSNLESYCAVSYEGVVSDDNLTSTSYSKPAATTNSVFFEKDGIAASNKRAVAPPLVTAGLENILTNVNRPTAAVVVG